MNKIKILGDWFWITIVFTSFNVEYSLYNLDLEKQIVPTLEEFGIDFLPFSPITKASASFGLKERVLQSNNFRKTNPPFNENTYLVYLEDLVRGT